MPANHAQAASGHSDADTDLRWMRRAISLARRGLGRVEPNPPVGCVIVRQGDLLGEGYHHRFGGAHAEVEALRACGAPPHGATVYVTLEPCCHFGKTPPCTKALIAAQVRRMVVAVQDPSPHAAGKGMAELRSAGIEVAVGLGAVEATRDLAPFLVRTVLGRPYVIAKWAQSIDGKLATQSGDSQWISGEASRRRVHRLRSRVDSIIVGSGTVLHDNPQLTARGVRVRRQALRVVLDGRLRIPMYAKLVKTAGSFGTLVVTTARHLKGEKARRLRERGVEVVACRTARVKGTARGGLDLRSVLRLLHALGATTVLVEGGPTVLSSLLDQRLVDEAHVYVSGRLIGGSAAPSAWGGRGATRIAAALCPHSVQRSRVGEDLLFRLTFTDPLTLLRSG